MGLRVPQTSAVRGTALALPVRARPAQTPPVQREREQGHPGQGQAHPERAGRLALVLAALEVLLVLVARREAQ